jgi:predicted ATP-grasp superfamily ATP-dependent carboligase
MMKLDERGRAESSTAKPDCGAVVLGGAHGSLAIARSLGRRGIPVCYITNDHPLARYSRYVVRSVAWAGPSEAGALDDLLQLAARHHLAGWVLFACGDAELQFVAQHRDALSAVFRVTTPPWEVTRWSFDKRLTHELATRVGVDSPRSYYPADRREVTQLDCAFPVIVKPTVHERRNAFTQAKAWRADDRAQLLARYSEAAALVGERAIVLQELIPGSGERQFSYAALCDRGVPVASLTARRTRQFPIDFGYTSTFVETIDQPEVEAAACRILAALEYSGLIEAEFKYDVRDRRYKLLDLNARAWTWIGLGAAAGVDFPYLAWQLAQGETPAPVRGKSGVRWMHVTRDLVASCQELLAGGGVSALGRYARSLRAPLTFATFAADDPLPAIVELPIVARRVLSRWRVAAAGSSDKSYTARPRTTL